MAKKALNMTEGTPIKLIMSFALPMLLGNIFQQMYNFADSAIVGRYVGGEALAAIGATGSINWFLIAVAIGITNGAGIIVAQCFGAGKFKQMKKAITAMIAVLIVLTVLTTAIGIIFAYPILNLLKVPQSIIHESAGYMRVMFIGCFAIVAYNCSSSILRSLGNSRTPLYMIIISSILNILLDLLFVIVFKMGVIGAGIATNISQVVSAILCTWYIIKNKKKLHVNKLPIKPEKRMIMSIFRTGLPSAMQSCLIALGGMSVQGLINTFGTDAMAAYTASSKIDSITIQIIISLATALSVYSSQNMGAGHMERIYKGLKQTLAVMVPVCVTLAVLILLFKEKVILLLLDPKKDAKSIEIACTYLSVIGIGYIIAGIMQSYQNLLRGAGDVNVCVIAGLAELSVRVAASYLFVNFFELNGIWYAIPFSWGCGCIIPIIRYYTGKWKFKKLVD